MKRKKIIITIIIAICITALYIISVCDYEGICIGMSQTDFSALIPEDDQVWCDRYSFFTNKWGNTVAVRFEQVDLSLYVAEIRCFSSLWTSKTPMALNRIKKDMSLFEVTSIIGIPLRQNMGGKNGLEYLCTNGQIYNITLVTHVTDSSICFVQSIYSYKPNT